MNRVDYFRTSASPFKTNFGNFIGNNWVPAKSGRTFKTTSPITGEVICTVARSEAADVEATLGAAHAAKTQLGKTSVAERRDRK